MTISASRPAPPAGESPAAGQLQIDVWSDLACPWCYVGKSRLDKAIASSPRAGAITVVVRSFELDPAMSHDARPNLEVLRAKYGLSLAQARALEDRAVAMAQREGLPFAVDRVLASSFDVHRVLHLAGTFGLDDQLLGVLQRTLFSGQANAYDHTVIADAASHLGVPRHRVEEVLASDEYAGAVRADEAEARRIGVTGVPFAVFGGRAAIHGATSREGYAKAIEQAWSRP
jgi:predicted DsbA family dithiol-disulfide isomerase